MPADARPSRSAGIVILASLAVIAALYVGRELLVPIALALLFTAVLRPLVRPFERAGLSAPVGSTVVIIVLLGVLAIGVSSLAGPVRDWIAQAPATFAKAQERLQTLRRPLQTITSAAERLERGVTGEKTAAGAGPESGTSSGAGPQTGSDTPAPGSAGAPPPPAAGGSGVAAVAAHVFGTTTAVLGGTVEVVLLTFLLLASGDSFLNKLLHVLPVRRDKREAVEIAHETEAAVSRYLIATAVINVGQGLLVGAAMALLHMPNPVLWGLLTFFLEFIPYLGGASMIILLTLVGLATYDSVGRAVLPPGLYLAITTLQNNLVSPVAYGRRLQLNPVAVFVGVLFWYYLWGVPGAFISVPVIAGLKIVGDHVERLSPLAEFLGD
jgi:predicted PurR-regulated permease PerM